MAVTDPITVTGLDDSRYEFLPMSKRAPLQFSNGSAVAFYPIVLVEYYEEVPPEGAIVAGDVYGGLGGGGPLRRPQVTRVGNRDYGHRVGFFRLMKMFVELGITPVIAIDAMAVERYPAIASWITTHDVEVIAHGIAITRAITSSMDVDEEASYIAESKARIESALSLTTKGWLGPTASESGRTLQLLVDAGFEYCLDWSNDEQPYYFGTAPALLSLPPFLELSDNHAINQRALYNESYSRALVDAASRLALDGRSSSRLLSFTLNTWTSGQPARSAYVRAALQEIVAMPGVWRTTPGEVTSEMASLSGRR